MAETGTGTDDVAANRELWTRANSEYADELYAPPDAPDHPYYTLANAEWARQWPAEEIWAAHLAD